MDYRSPSLASSDKTTTARIHLETQKLLDDMAQGQNLSKADLIGEAVKDLSASTSGISTEKVRAFQHYLSQLKSVFMESETERARMSKSQIFSEEEFHRKLLTQKVALEKEATETHAVIREQRQQIEQLHREVKILKEAKGELEAENKRVVQSSSAVQKTNSLLEQRNNDLEAKLSRYPGDLKENEALKDKVRGFEIALAKLESQYGHAEAIIAQQKAQFEEKTDLLVKAMRAEKEAEIMRREKHFVDLQKTEWQATIQQKAT